MMKKRLRLIFALPAILAFVFALCNTPRMAGAQNWTLSGTHIYNNNIGNVGIGMTAPASIVHVGDGNAVSALLGLSPTSFVLSQEAATTGMQGIVASSAAAGHRMNFEGIRARGTLAAPTVPVFDDRVLTLTGKIFDGNTVQNTAQITFFVDGAVSAGVAPQRISFRTGPTNTASKIESLSIESDGKVIIPVMAGVGTTTPGGLLGLADANTYLDVDGGGNLTFTDAVSGTKTLADLAGGGGGAETDPQVGANTTNYVPKWDGTALVTGTMFDDGTNIGIGTTSPLYKLHVNGTIRAEGADLAELFDTVCKENLELGDVAIFDTENPLHIKKSARAYDTMVAGIISSEEQAGYVAGTRSDGTSDKPLALAGRVMCKVSSENGKIEIGDLLTTSNTPGYAMKATDREMSFGAVLGKALQPLDTGKGQIMVFVGRH